MADLGHRGLRRRRGGDDDWLVMPWFSRLELCENDVDYLGHITAAAHLKLFEEARTDWLAEVTNEPLPSFVVVRQELDYRRELRLADGPVTITTEPLRLSRSTVAVHERMTSGQDALHTESHAVLVRWDRGRRRSMPFSARERQRIEAQFIAGRV
jgi:acyl-CoA thioesterase FadM